MMFCPQCQNTVYPKIAPAVIVGIFHGDELLLTRYAGRSGSRYALVAGYTEIGETAEDTVRREVKEEVGLDVKNLRYFKSQPWGLSGSLLLGFYAELDGADEVTLDTNELSEAVWVHRSDIDVTMENFSLTNEMIYRFKQGF
jgi:NAD+ diphosphatase